MTEKNGFPNYKEHPVRKAEDPRPYGNAANMAHAMLVEKPEPDHKMSEPGAAGAPSRVELFQNPPQTILNQPEEMTAPGEWANKDQMPEHLFTSEPDDVDAQIAMAREQQRIEDAMQAEEEFDSKADARETAAVIKACGNVPEAWALQFRAMMARNGLVPPQEEWTRGWFASAMRVVRENALRDAEAFWKDREGKAYEEGFAAGQPALAERERVAYENGREEGQAARLKPVEEVFGRRTYDFTTLELGHVLAVSWANTTGCAVDQLPDGMDWPSRWTDFHKQAFRAYMVSRP